MATDLEQIVRALTAFYDFTDKALVAVGAGGGQLFGYAAAARHVVAVDSDREALARLLVRATHLGLADRLALLPDDFLTVSPQGDVVLFEFCLHQMQDPERALAHARQLAQDVVVIDHAPGSRWSWCAAEERGVAAGWEAVARRAVRRQIGVEALQRFCDYTELEARLVGQGPESRSRISAYQGKSNLSVPMPYRLALL